MRDILSWQNIKLENMKTKKQVNTRLLNLKDLRDRLLKEIPHPEIVHRDALKIINDRINLLTWVLDENHEKNELRANRGANFRSI